MKGKSGFKSTVTEDFHHPVSFLERSLKFSLEFALLKICIGPYFVVVFRRLHCFFNTAKHPVHLGSQNGPAHSGPITNLSVRDIMQDTVPFEWRVIFTGLPHKWSWKRHRRSKKMWTKRCTLSLGHYQDVGRSSTAKWSNKTTFRDNNNPSKTINWNFILSLSAILNT